jgi:hypothetical protein
MKHTHVFEGNKSSQIWIDGHINPPWVFGQGVALWFFIKKMEKGLL